MIKVLIADDQALIRESLQITSCLLILISRIGQDSWRRQEVLEKLHQVRISAYQLDGVLLATKAVGTVSGY